MINIEETAKQLCIDYYQKKYFHQPRIDRENLRVQVENFEWNGAIYRIDVFFLHQKPSFIPYHQNFWMAHRLWMTKNGKAVKQEPVYSSSGVHPDHSGKSEENISGFYPGNYYFKSEMDFIDEALKKNSSFSITSGPDDLFTSSFQFDNGIRDLEKIDANIIQLSDGYKIIFEAEKYEATSGLFMHDISFEIFNDGKCSPIISQIREIPGLE